MTTALLLSSPSVDGLPDDLLPSPQIFSPSVDPHSQQNPAPPDGTGPPPASRDQMELEFCNKGKLISMLTSTNHRQIMQHYVSTLSASIYYYHLVLLDKVKVGLKDLPPP